MTDKMCIALKHTSSKLCSKYWYSGSISVNASNVSFFFFGSAGGILTLNGTTQ